MDSRRIIVSLQIDSDLFEETLTPGAIPVQENPPCFFGRRSLGPLSDGNYGGAATHSGHTGIGPIPLEIISLLCVSSIGPPSPHSPWLLLSLRRIFPYRSGYPDQLLWR